MKFNSKIMKYKQNKLRWENVSVSKVAGNTERGPKFDSRTHKVDRENWVSQVVLWTPHVWKTSTHIWMNEWVSKSMNEWEPGQITKWLRASVGLSDDPGSVSSVKWWLTISCNPRHRVLYALFWPPQALHMLVSHTYIPTNILKREVKLTIF